MTDRRGLLAGALAGTVALASRSANATPPVRFDRAAYDRYIALMNAGDLAFVDHYAADVRFVMGLRGRAAVRAFYLRQRPFVRERLAVDFFCSDAQGAAAQVVSEIRCIHDCDDRAIFGRPLRPVTSSASAAACSTCSIQPA